MPVREVIVCEHKNGLSLRLIVNQFIDGNSHDLVVNFGTYLGFMKYDEFLHPCDFAPVEDVPKIEGKELIYPCLIVSDSYWIERFPEHEEDLRRSQVNYRFIGQTGTVDVLSQVAPQIAWVKIDILVAGNWRGEGDYEFFISLGEEDGPEKCTSLGCKNLRIPQSTKCRVHHFEMIKGYNPRIGDF